MSEFFSQIVIGIIVAVILGWLGFGGSKTVVITNGRSRKTGKWITIISVIIAIITSSIASKDAFDINNPTLSYSIFMFSILLFFIGRAIAWFQK